MMVFFQMVAMQDRHFFTYLRPMNRTILRLAIPNILSNIAVPLLGLVDTALMGRMESEAYLGAIALGGILFSFIYWGLGFIRMGTTGLTAQAFGRKDEGEGIAVLARALLVGGTAGLILLLDRKSVV